MNRALSILIALCLASPFAARSPWPTLAEGDASLGNFDFDSGERLEELRIHYRTLGTPVHDARGVVRNAVLVMHGTTGSGAGFLSEQFAGVLFKPGGVLDAETYYIVLPDGIGHGDSSKPSDGMRARFPKYTYGDMVRAQYRLLTDALDIDHLRLVMGTSMGGMQAWMWGYTYPDFMDALFPLASLPVEIAGRNRIQRAMIINSITEDPAWMGGNYTEQPPGLVPAIHALMFMVSSPLQWQRRAPTRMQAETMMEQMVDRYQTSLDANDMVYAFDASRLYNPAPYLEHIQAPLLAINSADDQVNPPELGILEREVSKVRNGRALVLPITEETRGHGTHSLPALWGHHLQTLLETAAAR